MTSGGYMEIEAFAVRLVAGDFAPLTPGVMLQASLHSVRDHRSAALAAFRLAPEASHCFTQARQSAEASSPVVVCWRRVALLGALGEADAVPTLPGVPSCP